MFARVTTYQAKPGKIAAIEARTESVRAQVKQVPGLVDSYSVWSKDGKGVTFGVWESEQAANAANMQIQAIWASLSDLLDGPPTANTFENVRRLTE